MTDQPIVCTLQGIGVNIPEFAELNFGYHLVGTYGINVFDTWADYSGAGVTVGPIDTGFEYTRPELAPDYDTEIDYDFRQRDDDPFATGADNGEPGGQGQHGTSVIGLIGAPPFWYQRPV